MRNLSCEISPRCDTPFPVGRQRLANWQNRKATDEMDDADLLCPWMKATGNLQELLPSAERF